MTGKAYKLSVVLPLISGLTWTGVAQAFFCFSMGGGKRTQPPYTYHVPHNVFGLNEFQYQFYSPARPLPRINLQPPREEQPVTVEPMPVQHIFR